MKPLYNTRKGKIKSKSKRRRRLGEMPDHLKVELSNMDKFDRVKILISIDMRKIDRNYNK